MPIKGLSTREDVNLLRSFPVLADLRKGAEKQGNRPGADLTYFRVTFRPAFIHLAQAFDDTYGARAETFNGVQFPEAPVDAVFSSWMEQWRGNRTLERRCNGETQVKHLTQDGYNYRPIPCIQGQCQCKPTGKLLFLLPQFSNAVGVFGYFMLRTTSSVDVLTISNALYTVENLHGGISGIPFTLTRVEQQFTPIVNGKPMNVKKAMVKLFPSLMHMEAEGPALPSGQPDMAMLTDGIEADDTELDWYEQTQKKIDDIPWNNA